MSRRHSSQHIERASNSTMSGTEQPGLTSVAFPDRAFHRFMHTPGGMGLSAWSVFGTCEKTLLEKPQRSGMAAHSRSCCKL